MSNVCGLWFLPVDLLGLLNWRSNSQNIKHNLKKLMEVDGGEIVKVCLYSHTQKYAHCIITSMF